MTRPVVISGLGPVCGLGLGIDALWEQACAGASAIAPVSAFDASDFKCPYGAEVSDFSVRNFVPKTYRKATKVMARDIEFAVACADLAARDAGLQTKGTAEGDERSYASARMGAHIGAGLIAADVNELTMAMAESVDDGGTFDMHQWGREGMQRLTPLWLLKYLPNMLACHVTIIHDTHGPSNTITCSQASGLLSVGESLRVIQRDDADLCFCGGAESRVNPLGMLRQEYLRLTTDASSTPPDEVVRPMDRDATGTVVGEGGAILILEAEDDYKQRTDKPAYARITGFAASQTVHPAKHNREPHPGGSANRRAIERALADAGLVADDIDLIVPGACGTPAFDQAEAEALRRVFGDRLARLPVLGHKALLGECFAGSGAIDLAIAAVALAHQKVPAIVNRNNPLPGISGNAPARETPLRHALVCGSSVGGQNAAIVLSQAS
ncbi:beta-ketoacyl-[acyl-carrier-protein] synthase family protein [Mucisphaera calidilacus]|uniref:3-oxoacyl-[acyl-carrier-protein] synthase 2 n=1 Tax=Mucisphaera calidilacus TaxID=2527982 RepID=A0A518BTG2_9BACT|nr:beta-ketoacyl synthase N-terminal-like domain-containing protein [Mucisphaera calidilacus]QDU70262.1 3-oxoacyl-[acyl-carrier-protein] synthase 2 [Mucisphaera calidilacus]